MSAATVPVNCSDPADVPDGVTVTPAALLATSPPTFVGDMARVAVRTADDASANAGIGHVSREATLTLVRNDIGMTTVGADADT